MSCLPLIETTPGGPPQRLFVPFQHARSILSFTFFALWWKKTDSFRASHVVSPSLGYVRISDAATKWCKMSAPSRKTLHTFQIIRHVD